MLAYVNRRFLVSIFVNILSTWPAYLCLFTIRSTLRRSLDSAQKLKETFRGCPKLNSILQLAREMSLTEEQAIMDILFMLK
jgi:hypothetical protein